MMKRVAALTALAFTLLAVPATAAMASTSGSGSGYTQPKPVQLVCPQVRRLHRAYVIRHHKRIPIRIVCPIRVKPVPRGCLPRVLRFDMAAGGSTLTEVSGPTLAPAQEFSYDGSTYTIMSVNPGANGFTVFRDGHLFVNSGAAITGATALICCTR